MDRRAFCISGVSGALALAAVRLPAATTRVVSGRSAEPFAKVLFDSRFAAGRAYGAAAAAAGSPSVGFHGDLTEVWLEHLRPLWGGAAAPVAGMTTPSGLFCLEQLAKDHWLRVVERRPVGAANELVTWIIARS